MLPRTTTLSLFLLSLVYQTSAVFLSNECLRQTASYNETTGSCYCNQGYKGLGDLCCEDVNEWSNCNIGGDPWLSTYDGTQSSLNFPCTGRVAVINSKTGDGRSCKVEAWMASRVVDKGAIYPDGMTVAYTIANGDRVLFKFVKGTLQRPSDTTPQPVGSFYRLRMNRNTVEGESININYDFTRTIWTMTGCGTKINFRAVKDDSAVQETKRPGMCINVKNSADVKPTGNVAEGDLCSVSSSYQPEGVLATDLLSHLVGDLVNIGVTAQAVHPDYEGVCNNLGSVARTTCQNKLAKPSLKCAGVFYNTVVRACLTVRGATGPQMVDWFTKCLHFQCKPNPIACALYLAMNDPLRACIPNFCNL